MTSCAIPQCPPTGLMKWSKVGFKILFCFDSDIWHLCWQMQEMRHILREPMGCWVNEQAEPALLNDGG